MLCCLSHTPNGGPTPQACAPTGNPTSNLSVRRPARPEFPVLTLYGIVGITAPFYPSVVKADTEKCNLICNSMEGNLEVKTPKNMKLERHEVPETETGLTSSGQDSLALWWLCPGLCERFVGIFMDDVEGDKMAQYLIIKQITG